MEWKLYTWLFFVNKKSKPRKSSLFVFFVFSYLVQLMSYYMRLQCIHRWTKKINNVCCITAITLSRRKKSECKKKKNTPQLTITDGCALLSNHTLVLFKLVAREKKKKSENESGIRISKLNQSFAFRLGLNICRFYVAN